MGITSCAVRLQVQILHKPYASPESRTYRVLILSDVISYAGVGLICHWRVRLAGPGICKDVEVGAGTNHVDA